MQIDADSYANVRYQATTEVRQSTPIRGELPFNLDDMLKANDLIRISSSFDIMKNAINYILDSQKDQTVLINELLEASRDAPNPPFKVVDESDNEDTAKKSRPVPDYSALHRDFDRRISSLEGSKETVDKLLLESERRD